jgi:hypothetical protein
VQPGGFIFSLVSELPVVALSIAFPLNGDDRSVFIHGGSFLPLLGVS